MMTWYDSTGQGWMGRRPNGWPTDSKAPDGFTVGGFRRIDKLGRVRFAGTYWSHPKLLENIGRMIRCDWVDDGIGSAQVAGAYFGHPDTTPDNYAQHHSSFYESRSAIALIGGADWNKRPVTKF